MARFISIILLACVSAYANQGSLSESYNSLIYFIYQMIGQIAVVSGIGLCLGGLVQFRQYRQKASGVKMSSAVWLFVIGLLLIGLPYLPTNIHENLDDDVVAVSGI